MSKVGSGSGACAEFLRYHFGKNYEIWYRLAAINIGIGLCMGIQNIGFFVCHAKKGEC